MTTIVKRLGQTQEFDSRKVYGSVYASAKNAHLSEIQSEKIAETVSKRIEDWAADKTEITSQQIFNETKKVLATLHEDAAFLYETHRDIN